MEKKEPYLFFFLRLFTTCVIVLTFYYILDCIVPDSE